MLCWCFHYSAPSGGLWTPVPVVWQNAAPQPPGFLPTPCWTLLRGRSQPPAGPPAPRPASDSSNDNPGLWSERGPNPVEPAPRWGCSNTWCVSYPAANRQLNRTDQRTSRTACLMPLCYRRQQYASFRSESGGHIPTTRWAIGTGTHDRVL